MDCPSEQELIDYAHGELDSAANFQIELHLQQCELCSDAIAWWRQHLQMAMVDESSRDDSFSVSSLNEEDSDASDLWLERAEHKFDFSKLKDSSLPDSLGRLGRFEVLNVIGVGGMGVVFRCLDREADREVAVKTLADEFSENSDACERFRREARASMGIRHPNVVEVYGCEEHLGTRLIIMECVEGVTLKRLLKRRGPLEVDWAVDIARQIASGLQASHQRGVIHRDVKPGNIILTDSGLVKLTDFGLARLAIDDSELTKSGVMVGTPAYMAPEQVVLEAVDARADLFSLGCVLYFMLCGRSPFDGESSAEMAYRVVNEDPPPLSEFPVECPPALARVLAMLLAKSPEDRIESAKQLVEMLDAVKQAGLLEQKTRPARRSTATDDSHTRWRIGALSLAVVLFSLVIVAIIGLSVWTFFSVGKPALIEPAPRADTTPTSPQEPVRPKLDRKPRTLLVGENGEFDGLNDAIASAVAGDEIVLAAPLRLTEPILLDATCPPVTIDLAGSTLTAPLDASYLLRLENAQGIRIRNGRLRPSDDQNAISIAGNCEGLVLESCLAVGSPSSRRALVAVESGAVGTTLEPIRLRRCRFDGGRVGVAMGEDGQVGRIRIESSRFIGVANAIELDGAIDDVVIHHCAIINPREAITIHVDQPRLLEGLQIVNNTIVGGDVWLRIAGTAKWDGDVVAARNLIVDSKNVEASPSDRLRFANNWWRHDGARQTEPYAISIDGPLIDRRRDAKTYLHPLPDSPFVKNASIGLRIGAFPLPPEADVNPPN